MNSFNKINKKNNKTIKKQSNGLVTPGRWIANVIRSPVSRNRNEQQYDVLGWKSDHVCCGLARANKMSAILKPPQGVTTTSCQSADVPTTSASISRAVCGQSDPRLNKKYRAAHRHIERLSKISAEAMSSEDKRNLIWAKAYIAETSNSGASASVKAAPKRQRSGDDVHQTSTVQSRKKPRRGSSTITNRPFSEVAKDPLVRALVDRSNADGAITHDQWGLINQRLLDSYLKATADSTCPSPQCTDAGWFQGAGEVWPGARLGLVSVDDIPRRPRAAAMVPAEPHEPEAILRILQRANPGLPTQDWRVVSVSEVQGFRRKVVVVLNRESLPALRIRQGMIFYGYMGIRLCLYRGDDKLDHRPSSAADTPCPNTATATQPVVEGEGVDKAVSDTLEDSQSDQSLIGRVLRWVGHRG
ncbi:hypothetical protein EVAR_91119_1 [Eumeta japonica]|uniref:DUF4780 domain-containing protein n=1 Tax=Eumeta variegata TaxID=151549 RepID=A0A4C1SDA3_EUMVA|nr:hypothetical protein EVAR_91119_1 [Eumeta japonica]